MRILTTEATKARPDDCRRRGAVTLELLLVLPIPIIGLLAVVQFGLFHSNVQLVQQACRDGALEASQTGGLPMAGAVPATILAVIDQQLQSEGISYCRVRLEHNVGGMQSVLISPVAGACDCEPTSTLGMAETPLGEYVRLSVCVQLNEVMPNCLASFGLDIADPTKTVSCTSVYRYELTSP